MKKIICLFLSVLMLMMIVVPVSASGAALALTASAVSLSRGSEVSIAIDLQGCDNCKSVALVFDYDTDNIFEVVSGEWKLTGALLNSFDTKTTKAGTAAVAYASETNLNGNIFELKLKVKDNAPIGSATVTVTPTIKNGSVTIPCSSGTVTINIVCQHENKTFVPAKAATHVEQGWDAYYKCDNCSQLFAADGAAKIDAIPYIPVTGETEEDATVLLQASADQKTAIIGREYTFDILVSGSFDGFSCTLDIPEDLIYQNAVTETIGGVKVDITEFQNGEVMMSVLGGCEVVNGEKLKIASVTLKIDESAAVGKQIINLKNVQFSDEFGDKISSVRTEYLEINIIDHIPGDINGDNTVDYYDVAKIYACYRGKATITDTVILDVNLDGEFNYYDVSKLYAFYRGKTELPE